MRSIKKKITVFALIIVLVLSQLSFASAVETDYTGHWAQDTIEEWFNNGIVKGYSDGSFKPDNVVTRAEFVTMINNLFGFVEEDTNMFTDVSENDWFYHNVNKGTIAGIIEGSNGMFRPEDKITRQEATVVLARAFNLSAENKYAYTYFNDRDMISNWATQSVNALVESNYIKGRGNNELAPLANLTRAEAITLISNIAGDIVQQASTVTGTFNGNLFVNVADVVIKDTTIKGNLYIAEGVGEGDITLDNVIVEGELVVLGGGENSVNINNSDIGSVLVVKIGGHIRIVAIGDTSIGTVEMMSGGILEEYHLTGVGFGDVEVFVVGEGEDLFLNGDFDVVIVDAPVDNITITDGSIGSLVIDNGAANVNITVDDSGVLGTLEVREAESVVLNGDVEQFNVSGPVGSLTVEDGKIGEIIVSEESEGAIIDLQEGCVIEKITIDGTVDVVGAGLVEEAVVNVEDVTFDEEPEEVSGSADSITIGDGEELVEIDQPSMGGSSGGGTITPSETDVTFVIKNGSRLDEPLHISAAEDATGEEILEEILTEFVDKFDEIYSRYEVEILDTEGFVLIDAIGFFEHAEPGDLDGTIYSGLTFKSGAEYTPAEKKAMLKDVIVATRDNITDGTVVQDDLAVIAERVDFTTVEYDGQFLESIIVTKNDSPTPFAEYFFGGNETDYINNLFNEMKTITMTGDVKYTMTVTLKDNSQKLSIFGTDGGVNPE